MNTEGDDGDLQMGIAWPDPRFTDNGDDPVTDNLAGLMWTKYGLGLMTWNNALDECDSCTVGNYDDWRLPNVKELQSLIHYGFRNPWLPDTIGTGHGSECNPFCGVSNFTWFWSSTSVFSDISINYAWMVGMHEGSLDIRHKDDPISVNVWPVRGGK
jgi:hypothetical protein